MSVPQDAPHIPVMLDEVMSYLDVKPNSVIIDGTFGAGGYTKALLGAGANVIAIDRDPNAIAAGAELAIEHAERLSLVQGEFAALDMLAVDAGHALVDGVVLDIGVSSMQIDEAERGFSFQNDGPLDMRMSQAGPTAADVVNQIARPDLTRIIGILGEERRASQVSKAICERRDATPFTRTADLAKVVENVVGRGKKDKIHPATRTFQALRIFVNGELEQLAQALMAAERILKPGGRLVVVTFHSLEDRLVKRFFSDRASDAAGSRYLPQGEAKLLSFKLSKKGAVSASAEEAERNPRARSAKLRVGERLDCAAFASDLAVFGLPDFSNAGFSKLEKAGM